MQRVLRSPAFYLALAALILTAHQTFYAWELGLDAVDDAYISFRYAKNLVRGEGLIFNSGERVEGYTNFLWAVLVAPAIALGLEPGPFSMLLGATFAIATIILIYKLFPPSLSPWAAAIAALFLAADGSFALWSVSGMETALFGFLLTWGMLLYLREEQDERYPIFTGLILASASLARPEGVLAFSLTMLHSIIRRAARGESLLAPAEILRAASFLGLWLPYFLWRWGYYGYPLPNTFYAKVTTSGPVSQIARGVDHLMTFLSVRLAWLLIPLALWPLLRRKITVDFTYLGLIVSGFWAYIIYVGGDWSVGRFFAPVMPAFYLLVANGLIDLYRIIQDRVADQRPLRIASPVVVGLLAATLIWQSSWRGEYGKWLVPFQAKLATQARVTMGRWLREHMPPDTFIAVDAAGQMPYFSESKTLDFWGITDANIAHMPVESLGQGLAGHDRFAFDYVLARRPDLIIVYGNFLDGSDLYLRADWPWTDDPGLVNFLTIYRRADWNPGIEY